MNPDTINSQNMLPDDHILTATTTGVVLSSDTTMTDGCLVLQSESKVRLTSGFKSYEGSLGHFKVIPGCADSEPLTTPQSEKVQRDHQVSTALVRAKSSGIARDR